MPKKNGHCILLTATTLTCLLAKAESGNYMLKLAMCCLNNKKIQKAHCCPVLPCPTLAPVGKNCTALTAPFNGKVTGTGFTPGTGLFFACNAPYVLQGSVVRYCNVSGTWSGVPATCSSKRCQCYCHVFLILPNTSYHGIMPSCYQAGRPNIVLNIYLNDIK